MNVVVTLVLCYLASVWASARLGDLAGVSQTAPWSWLTLSTSLPDAYHPAVNRILLSLGTAWLLALLLHLVVRLALRRRSDEANDIHGTADWASRADIESAGLLSPTKNLRGVYVGSWLDEREHPWYLKHDGPEHVLAFAPTRSGKGVGLVLPTLLDWNGSAIIHDPKAEAWSLTAGWRRSAGHSVLYFDPTTPPPLSVRFNPLAELRIGQPEEVADAQNLAHIIADPEGQGLQDHWAKTAQALLTGVILHACYMYQAEHDRTATLSDVATMLSDPARSTEDLLEEMVGYPHTPDGPHPVIGEEARAMLNRDEREMSSVLSTAISFLSLYRDPMVSEAMACSDFRIDDLINADNPVSLYLVVRPSDASRLRPLIRLLLTQVVRRLTGKMTFQGGRVSAHYNHRLLLLLDEFAALAKMPAIEDALPYMAGYGIKCYLIVQDISQLQHVYGNSESITSNCHVRVAFAPNKIETAEVISKMCGDQTVVRQSISASGGQTDLLLSNVSESRQQVRRPLLTPDEVLRLPGPTKTPNGDISLPGDMLIFCAGKRPIYGKQILFFLDPIFLQRSQIAPPTNSDRLTEN